MLGITERSTLSVVQSFERIGYRNLASDTLVELKALNVTPEFVTRVRQSLQRDASLDRIVELKALGIDNIGR